MARGPLPALVYKIMCGRRLTMLRDRADLSQQDVANQFGWSQAKVAYIETGTSAVQADTLDKLLAHLGADEAGRAECHHLAELGRTPPPRRKRLLRNRFGGDMRSVIDMDGSAATRWEHSSMIIPGVLQTEAYMRYLFRAYRPSPTREQIDQYTELRLGRQTILDNADQMFWFVIHEAALRSLENIDGDDSVLRGQAQHLMDAIDRPNIEVQIAPFRHGYYPGQEESYVIFGFDTDPPATVTYVEKYDGGDILHDPKNLTRFGTFWEHQRVHALGPEQTRPFLRGLSRPS